MTEIIFVFLNVIMIAFFAGAETAFVSCNKMRLKYKEEKGDVRAKAVLALMQNTHRVIGTALVGNNLFVVTASIVATHGFEKYLGGAGALVATLVMTPIILVFGEMLPKAAARIRADSIILSSVFILKMYQIVFSPVVILIEKITNVVVKKVKTKKTVKDPFLTKEDIELLVRQITREGVIDRSEQGAIHQIFDFRYTRVGDIMVRLHEVACIDYTDDRSAIVEKAKKYRFTRYPVMANKQIKGILNIFDLFYSEEDWRKFIRPVRQIYANQRVNKVLYEMQRKKEIMNVVVRGGKCIGIVTLKDIINEIELI